MPPVMPWRHSSGGTNAELSDSRFLMIGLIDRADREDGGDDEQDYGNSNRDHDIARQAALRFASDVRDSRQIVVSRCALQHFSGFPGRLRPCVSYCVPRVRFDPRGKFRRILNSRVGVKLDQQTRGFRLDFFPAA